MSHCSWFEQRRVLTESEDGSAATLCPGEFVRFLLPMLTEQVIATTHYALSRSLEIPSKLLMPV